MLSQIIWVVLHLCGQGNLITIVWRIRDSQGIFIIKQSGNPGWGTISMGAIGRGGSFCCNTFLRNKFNYFVRSK